MSAAGRGIAILDGAGGPELAIVEAGGEARAVVWPGVGADARSLHHVWLEAEGRTVELSHPSDAVYYVIAGDGSVEDPAGGEGHALRAGSMFHVDAGTAYRVMAGPEGMDLVGGPAPADPALYASLKEG